MSTLQSTLRLSVIDGVSAKMRGITNSFSALRNQSRRIMSPMNGMMAGAIGLTAGYFGVREGMRGTVGAAMDFESAFADVRKVVDGSDDQLAMLRRDIIGLSKDMTVAASGFAEIYAAAGQSNIPIQEMKKFSKMVAEVSTAWEVPVAQTGQALAEIKNQLHMGVDEIGLYADAINHLGNNTAARAPDLVDYSKRVAATGELYGFAAAETLAFGGAMIASGAQSEVATTSFRNMGQALTMGSRATKSQREAFKQLGLDAVKTAKSMQKNAVKTTLDVIDRIQKLSKDERNSFATALFGKEARALMPIINNSTELRRQLDLVGDSANYAGSSFEEYRIRAETTANTLDKVKNNFTALGIGIGDSLLPGINSALSGVLDVFDTLDKRSSFFDEFKIGMKGFMQGLGFKDAREMVNSLADALLGPALDGKGMSDAGEGLGRLFMKAKEWGTSIRELSAAIRDNPLAQFMGEIAGKGFKYLLVATGIGLLAKAIFGLGRALFFLSGAKLAVDILKGVIALGGPLIAGKGGAASKAGTAAAAAATATAAGSSGKGRGLGNRGRGLLSGYFLYDAVTSIPTDGTEFKDFIESNSKRSEGWNEWLEKNIGTPSSWLGIEEGGPSLWDRFMWGKANDPDFNFREHMGIKTRAGAATREKQTNLIAPAITDLNKPSGTQDVRVVNQAPPSAIHNYVTVHATTQADPDEIGAIAADAVGQATASALEANYSDAIY